jgi:hypothetical protein
MYQANYRNRSGRRPVRGCISGILVLLVILGGIIFVVGRVRSGVTVSVSANPTIIANECDGTVTVLVGPANQVTLAGLFPTYNQDTSANTIKLNSCDNGATLTVPAETNLTLDTNAGNIIVFGVSGTMNLSSNGGNITLVQSTLEGHSKLDDNGAPIIFSGNLAQGSVTNLSGNSSSIDVTLPGATSFNLEVSGILGPFISNVPAINITPGEDNVPAVNVGSNPSYASLQLDLNDTAVLLRSGS